MPIRAIREQSISRVFSLDSLDLSSYLFHKIDVAILNDDAVVGVVDWAS